MKSYIKDRKMFAFNIWDVNSAKAVLDSAKEMNCPVILQTSTRIYKGLHAKTLRYFVDKYSEESGVETWLHLDHCKEINVIEDAISNGWDSVMIDASKKPIEENIRLTNQVEEIAHRKGILVEAEVGQIQGVEEDIESRGRGLASREDIREFIENTNVDMIAVAFGNAHGQYKEKPRLDIDLVKYTAELSDIPFVVHGGSGLSDEVLRELIGIKNVSKVNISTELKLAYLRGITKANNQGLLSEEKIQPTDIENKIYEEIRNVVRGKCRLLKQG